MGMRTVNSPYGSNDLLVDARLGSAYPTVESVSRHLLEITFLAENAGRMYDWYDQTHLNAQEVITLSEQVRTDKEAVDSVSAYVTETLPVFTEYANEVATSFTEIKSIETRITETTTMDFLNFEVDNNGNLLVHFAGYADDSKFNINNSGELEVTL